MKKIAIVCVVLASALYGAGALADGWGRGHNRHGHGHGHHDRDHSSFRLYLGAPLLWSSHWYRPHYYPSYPRTVVIQRQPEVYVQREVAAVPSGTQQDYWYYCPDSRTYYPYAQTCPSPWLQVVPQTAPR